MDIAVQYLEGGPAASDISPEAARTRLADALDRVPFSSVLLGWDLSPRLVEACAEECARHGCDLYLWQPMLTGHGSFGGDPRQHAVSLSGAPVPALDGKLEFTFLCPNRPEVRESVLQCLGEALESGCYRGVFLDRIRFPSPVDDVAGRFACFCDACQEAARDTGLDLLAVRQGMFRLLRTIEGRRATVVEMLSGAHTQHAGQDVRLLSSMLDFRAQSISRFVTSVAQVARSRGLKVGLDCFSPALARLVGQDLTRLDGAADWIKVMTYARAFAPASLSYESLGLVNWLMSSGEETEQDALACLAEATGWALPPSRDALRAGGLPASVLTQEIERGRSAKVQSLLAGIELVEMPGVAQLNTAQICADAEALRVGQPDGVVLCWDLWRIPLERVKLAGSLFGPPA